MNKKYGSFFSLTIVFLCVLTIVLYIVKAISLKGFLGLIIGLSVISLIAIFGEIMSKKNKPIPIPSDDTVTKIE